jgi:hypothetical protein
MHFIRKICSISGLTSEITRKRDRISDNKTVRLPVVGLTANGLRVAIIPTDNRIGIFTNTCINNKKTHF